MPIPRTRKQAVEEWLAEVVEEEDEEIYELLSWDMPGQRKERRFRRLNTAPGR